MSEGTVGTRKAYTDEQAKQMVADYESGMTLREVGEKHYCCWATVVNYIKRQDIKLRSRNCSKRDVKKILQDWNEGMPTREIVKKYRFRSINSLYHFTFYWRSKGYDFERRK